MPRDAASGACVAVIAKRTLLARNPLAEDRALENFQARSDRKLRAVRGYGRRDADPGNQWVETASRSPAVEGR